MTQNQTTMKAIEILVLLLAPRFNALQIHGLKQVYFQSKRRESLAGATLMEYFLLELLAENGRFSYPMEAPINAFVTGGNPRLTVRTDSEEENTFIHALHDALVRCFQTDSTDPIEAIFSNYSGGDTMPYMLQIAEAFSHCKNGTGSKINDGELPETWIIAICLGEATIADHNGDYGNTQAVYRQLVLALDDDDSEHEEMMIQSALHKSFLNWRNTLYNPRGVQAIFNSEFGIGDRIIMDVIDEIKRRSPEIQTSSVSSPQNDFGLIGIKLPSGAYDVFAVGLYGRVNSVIVNYLGNFVNVDFEEIEVPFPQDKDWDVVDIADEYPTTVVSNITNIIFQSMK